MQRIGNSNAIHSVGGFGQSRGCYVNGRMSLGTGNVSLSNLTQTCEGLEAFFLFDSKLVVHGDSKLLFTPEVPLRGLDGHMPQQELNLIQFPTSRHPRFSLPTAELEPCGYGLPFRSNLRSPNVLRAVESTSSSARAIHPAEGHTQSASRASLGCAYCGEYWRRCSPATACLAQR